MADLWIASANPKKRSELEALLQPLGLRLRTPAELDAPFDPVEDQPDFAGNARIKALALARITGGVVLADDSGLCVDALGGRPGVHSARYGGPGLTDRERVRLLLAELSEVPDAQRTAHFTCNLCLAGPEGPRIAVEAHCHGVLLRAPRGDQGFGYDPIFVPRECLGRDPPPSFAELDSVTKAGLSHRGRALRLLLERLATAPAILAR